MRAAVALAVLAATTFGAAAEPFEHYVLALSWSPTFCATPAGDREPLQCDADADRTFIVHGLWPNADGRDLTDCRVRDRPTRAEVDAVLEVMPSPGLARHQWRKHGSCSGLSPAAYFAAVREAFARLAVPPGLATLDRDLEVRREVVAAAFIRANPGLTEDGIALRCEGDRLEEVRICLSPDLSFTACRSGRAETCGAGLVDVPAPE